MAGLELHAVDKFYGTEEHGVHAVKALDMRVEPGEIVALLGSSGCGKTSTLRMIAGFEPASRGRIALAGRDIHELAPVKRGVAMAFEGYSLYPPLTVRENVAFALKAARLDAATVARRVDEIGALLEIDGFMDKYPTSLSGGQQQRASLARALVRDADLHLLDEPMGQLEPQLRAVLRGRIKHFIKERALTAILVTHDQTEANALADRIAVMEDGELQQFDSPERLKTRPANLFTGTFIGEPPMNVFDVATRVADGRVGFRFADGSELGYPVEALSGEVVDALASRERLTLGVRPYAVRRAEQGLEARVIASQWLGDQTHIATEFGGGSLVMVEHDRAALAPDTLIRVAIAPDDLHAFDPEDGRALLHGRELAIPIRSAA